MPTIGSEADQTGGTLLIGVTDDGEAVGLDPDYAIISPGGPDGFINWLDTMLENQLGHAGAQRVLIRIEDVNGTHVCRVDVPASSVPVWLPAGKQNRALYVRRNNSTRAVPDGEIEEFLARRFGITPEGDT